MASFSFNQQSGDSDAMSDDGDDGAGGGGGGGGGGVDISEWNQRLTELDNKVNRLLSLPINGEPNRGVSKVDMMLLEEEDIVTHLKNTDNIVFQNAYNPTETYFIPKLQLWKMYHDETFLNHTLYKLVDDSLVDMGVVNNDQILTKGSHSESIDPVIPINPDNKMPIAMGDPNYNRLKFLNSRTITLKGMFLKDDIYNKVFLTNHRFFLFRYHEEDGDSIGNVHPADLVTWNTKSPTEDHNREYVTARHAFQLARRGVVVKQIINVNEIGTPLEDFNTLGAFHGTKPLITFKYVPMVVRKKTNYLRGLNPENVLSPSASRGATTMPSGEKKEEGGGRKKKRRKSKKKMRSLSRTKRRKKRKTRRKRKTKRRKTKRRKRKLKNN